MLTVLINAYGANDVVEVAEVERPSPQTGEVLIKVSAAGVNPIDWKIRDGAGERMGLTLPIHLGGEFVGAVEDMGPGAAGFERGEIVFGMVRTGAFSQYLTVNAADIVRKPGNLDITQAAALPLAGTTAWQAMFDEAKLCAGQRLLITGASGGVGSLAVQLAKAKGAHVTAMTSARNAEFVRGLGADEVVDYTARPFEEVVHDINVVLDTVGGDTFRRALATLRKGGIMVTIVAFPEGEEAKAHGVRVKRAFTVANAGSLRAITALVEAGRVTPHVEKTFPLVDVKTALALSAAGRVRGKIVLTIE
ncbi:NADP-dependent oxidoreductase [Cereibacter sphaeroides]|uniref:NADP-dependent oxidoreductase n=1 Tax=Cereibacter sphaeroides TaxID=1063 RepID=UPI000191C961|nr:NADP-dependent oxidoreductase [Cereibacter sphaeroides]ACM01830.1 oxidoreductase [Cereibacter sphaeroides KD131]